MDLILFIIFFAINILIGIIKNPNHSRAVGIFKPQIGIIDIAAELRGLKPNLSNKKIPTTASCGVFFNLKLSLFIHSKLRSMYSF